MKSALHRDKNQAPGMSGLSGEPCRLTLNATLLRLQALNPCLLSTAGVGFSYHDACCHTPSVDNEGQEHLLGV